MGTPIARVHLYPRFEVLELSWQVSCNLPVIKKKDPAPFAIADAITKRVGFASVLGGEIRLAHVPVRYRQITISHGELRVDGDRTLKVGDRGRSAMCINCADSG